jgi:hypothetical protein
VFQTVGSLAQNLLEFVRMVQTSLKPFSPGLHELIHAIQPVATGSSLASILGRFGQGILQMSQPSG